MHSLFSPQQSETNLYAFAVKKMSHVKDPLTAYSTYDILQHLFDTVNGTYISSFSHPREATAQSQFLDKYATSFFYHKYPYVLYPSYKEKESDWVIVPQLYLDPSSAHRLIHSPKLVHSLVEGTEKREFVINTVLLKFYNFCSLSPFPTETLYEVVKTPFLISQLESGDNESGEDEKEVFFALFNGYKALWETVIRIRQAHRYDNNKMYRSVISWTKENLDPFFIPKLFRVIDFYDTNRILSPSEMSQHSEMLARYFSLSEMLISMNCYPSDRHIVSLPYLWSSDKVFLAVFSYFKLQCMIEMNGYKTTRVLACDYMAKREKYGIKEVEEFC